PRLRSARSAYQLRAGRGARGAVGRVLSAAIWPGLLLAVIAISIAGRRVYIVAWRAPVAAAPLTAALQRQIARGEVARAIALCRALEPAWAAQCAEQCLQTEPRSALARVVEDLRDSYAERAGQGLEALRALSRMSFPLALGTAIVTMSGAFAAADVTRVEQALSGALQCMTVGVMTAMFCRMSAVIVSRQGAARMKEISVVCRGTIDALGGDARPASTQA
ncbi:MAG TPA: hypothetical protein VMF89_07465, partial [Polyangiales bacterium]|nr:hypothetical protein [Polyangiales bacterium]